MLVYITRHAQPGSPSDPPAGNQQLTALTDLGRTQAQKLGNRLAEMEFSGTVYVSPFDRCLETAEWICRQSDTVFYPEPAIAEVAGSWIEDFDGLSIDEIRDQYSCCDESVELDWPWWPETEETQEDVQTRVDAFLQDRVTAGSDDVLLVGHGATTGAAVSSLTGRGVESEIVGSVGFDLHYNATLTVIETGDTSTFRYQNDTRHLDTDEVTNNSQTIE